MSNKPQTPEEQRIREKRRFDQRQNKRKKEIDDGKNDKLQIH